jgi:ArsR family transcriptional regulator
MTLRTVWQTLADPTRLRLLALLRRQELSVAELQEALRLGQSRISTHLGVLRSAGLVAPRREGKHTYYSLVGLKNGVSTELKRLLEAAWLTLEEIPESAKDAGLLERVLEKRRAATREYFNRIAGRLGKSFCPGRTWAEVGPLLALMLPRDAEIADLGAGEGWLAAFVAQTAKRVIAVDNSPKMVAFAKAEFRKRGMGNVEYRLGDLAAPPVDPASVDFAVMSQALHHAVSPPDAISAAARLLRPGGRLLILDLNEHHFDRARDLYGDTWLGFNESDLHRWLGGAGLTQIRIQLLAPEPDPPHLQPLLACGTRE